MKNLFILVFALTNIIKDSASIIYATLIFIISLFCFNTSVNAQDNSETERAITLWGHVRNSFTTRGLAGAKITIMKADSTIIDSIKTWKPNNDPFDGVYSFKVPATPQKFIIRAEYPNYETTYVTFNMKYITRNTWFDVPTHFMKYKISMEKQLNEVTVTASKVQIVYKGDTVVYNANAFNVPEGSMLDGLIRQLPGVELKDNGQIYVNGRKVDYLTLNGKDFFKGKNKVMLDNLPYYTVKNIQVYNKNTEKSEWLGTADAPKDFVMDVQLKREYSTGYMINSDVAGGTKERYAAKAFGLRFTDHSRLSLYANLNNTNELRKPGENGEWSPAKDLNNGSLDYKRVGIEVYIDEKNKKWKEVANAMIEWTDNSLDIHIANERFLPSGNAYNRQRQWGNVETIHMELHNNFTLKKPFWLNLQPGFYYSKDKTKSNRLYAGFSQDPAWAGSTVQILDSVIGASQNAELMQSVVNLSQTSSYEQKKYLSPYLNVNFTKKFIWGDDLDVYAGIKYENRENILAAQEHIEYVQSLTQEYQHTHTNYSMDSYYYYANAHYTVHTLDHWNYRGYLNYEQFHSSTDNPRYKLDKLDGWEYESDRILTDMPCTQDSLDMALDSNNSFWSTNTRQNIRPGVKVYYQKEGNGKDIWFGIDIPVHFLDQEYKYHTTENDTILHYNTVIPTPDMILKIYTHNYDRYYFLHYGMSYNTPNLHNMVNIRNNEDPLNIRLGNPDLKTAITQKIEAEWRLRNRKYDQTIAASLGGRFTKNALANGSTYDESTGITTYKYENVNGNWSTYGTFRFNRTLDKNKRWTIQTKTSLSFTHSVGISAIQGETGDEKLSKVDTWRTGNSSAVSYRFGSLVLGANAAVDWRNSQSERAGFETINTVEYNYGLTGTYTLPWKIQMATDIKMFSRRGYSDKSMNTNDLVWNAAISRPFAKDRLLLKVEGFDILNQLSNTQYTINAQGRQEVWINSIPNYVMLHLQWKFSYMPKKK